MGAGADDGHGRVHVARTGLAERSTYARTDFFGSVPYFIKWRLGVLPFQGDTSAVMFDAILNRDPIPVNSKQIQHCPRN